VFTVTVLDFVFSVKNFGDWGLKVLGYGFWS